MSEPTLHPDRTGDPHTSTTTTTTRPASETAEHAQDHQHQQHQQHHQQVSSSSTTSPSSSSAPPSVSSSSSPTTSSPEKDSSAPAASQNVSQTSQAQMQPQPQPQAQSTRSSMDIAHDSTAATTAGLTDHNAHVDADDTADAAITSGAASDASDASDATVAGTAADGDADDGSVKGNIATENNANVTCQATTSESTAASEAPNSPSQPPLSTSPHAWDDQTAFASASTSVPASAQESRRASHDSRSKSADVRMTPAGQHEDSGQSLVPEEITDAEIRLHHLWTVHNVTNFTDAYHDDNDESNDDSDGDISDEATDDDRIIEKYLAKATREDEDDDDIDDNSDANDADIPPRKENLSKLWKNAFEDLQRPQPYECKEVSPGQFLPITNAEIYTDMLRDPQSLPSEKLYALAANTATALKAWQDEYYAIDHAIKLITRQPHKKGSDPRQPENPLAFEDKKEAALYGYKYEANHHYIGNQDAWIQNGFKPTAIQAQRMKDRAENPHNVDGWPTIELRGRHYIPRMRTPGKDSSKQHTVTTDTSTKTLTRAARQAATAAAEADAAANSAISARLMRRKKFGGPKRPVIKEEVDGPSTRTRQQQSSTTRTTRTKTTATAAATAAPETTTTTTTTRGRRGRPPAQPQTRVQQPEAKEPAKDLAKEPVTEPAAEPAIEDARLSPKEESQKRDAAEAASILTSLNEVTMPAPIETRPQKESLPVREEQQVIDTMQRPLEVVRNPIPEEVSERQVPGPPAAQPVTTAMPATTEAPPVTATAPTFEASSAPPSMEISQSPRPAMPLGNPLLDPKNQEKIRLSKNPKRTEAMIMHWAKFNSEGRMRNPKRTKAQIEAAKVTGMNEGASKPGRKRKARGDSEATPQQNANGVKGEEQTTAEASTNKRPKPSSRAVSPTTVPYSSTAPTPVAATSPVAPTTLPPLPPHASLASSEMLPASAPLPPHHTIPAALHPVPPPGPPRHLMQPVAVHPATTIALTPPQPLPRNNPHQIQYTTVPHQHHLSAQAQAIGPPPSGPLAAATYATPVSAPHILYATHDPHPLPPPYHLPPALTAPGGPLPPHHHHHHPHRMQYAHVPPHQPPPAIPPPPQARMQYQPGF